MVKRLAPKLAAPARVPIGDTEKLTINLGVVDLGQIDLLVEEGFYSNRTDLIRTAIRNQVATHAEVIHKSVARRTLHLGLLVLTRAELEDAVASRHKVRINVVGLARIESDVTAALARAAIASVHVLGSFQASAEVRAALADRIHP